MPLRSQCHLPLLPGQSISSISPQGTLRYHLPFFSPDLCLWLLLLLKKPSSAKTLLCLQICLNGFSFFCVFHFKFTPATPYFHSPSSTLHVVILQYNYIIIICGNNCFSGEILSTQRAQSLYSTFLQAGPQ